MLQSIMILLGFPHLIWGHWYTSPIRRHFGLWVAGKIAKPPPRKKKFVDADLRTENVCFARVEKRVQCNCVKTTKPCVCSQGSHFWPDCFWLFPDFQKLYPFSRPSLAFSLFLIFLVTMTKMRHTVLETGKQKHYMRILKLFSKATKIIFSSLINFSIFGGLSWTFFWLFFSEFSRKIFSV